MKDIAVLMVNAGRGGHGRVSFERQKFRPRGGPSGGEGGQGGSVILRAVQGRQTLDHLVGVREISAQVGGSGGKQKMFGETGRDTVIEVPVGTQVWCLAELRDSEYNQWPDGAADRQKQRIFPERDPHRRDRRYRVELETELLTHPTDERVWMGVVEEDAQQEEGGEGKKPSAAAGRLLPLTSEQVEARFGWTPTQRFQPPRYLVVDLTQPGQEFLLCRGGQGGRGNTAFASSRTTTPLTAEYGEWGETKLIALEVKLVADIGLVGPPNVGKSTLLSVLTNARPEIANYPFTTKDPNLGVWKVSDDRSLIVADIPGLIEAASQGKGLGFQFLRHIERCRALLYGVSLEEYQLQEPTDRQVAAYEDMLSLIKRELQQYQQQLLSLPSAVVVLRTDLLSPENTTPLRSTLAERHPDWVWLSSATQTGLDNLRLRVLQMIE